MDKKLFIFIEQRFFIWMIEFITLIIPHDFYKEMLKFRFSQVFSLPQMLSAFWGWRWLQQSNGWLQEALNYLFHFSKTKLKYECLFFFLRKVNQRYAFSCWKKMYAALVSGFLFGIFPQREKWTPAVIAAHDIQAAFF